MPLFMAATAGCSKPADGKTDGSDKVDAVPVMLEPVQTEPVQRTVDMVGTLCGTEEATISAKVSGRLVRLNCDLGDRVPPGATLAVIDPTDYNLALAQKETALQATLAQLGLAAPPDAKFDPDQVPTVARARWLNENAKSKLGRGQKLFDQQPRMISEEEFEDLKAATNVAESAYRAELLTVRTLVADIAVRTSDIDAARQKIADTAILAPGPAATPVVPEVSGKQHSTVIPSERSEARNLAVDVAASATARRDPSASLGVTAEKELPEAPGAAAPDLPASYAVAARMASLGEYVREGTPIFRLVADNPLKFRVQASERFIPDTVIGQEVRVTVAARKEVFTGRIARISPQVDPANRTFAIEIAVDNAAGLLKAGSFAHASILTRVDPRVTFVPLDAIVTFAGATKVFAVQGGKAVDVPVRTGIRRENRIEVTGSLAGVEQVVTSGVSKLADGVPVTIREKAEATPASGTPAASGT